jgi:hypothetical protein
LTSKRRKAAKSVLALAELAIASGHTVTLEYSETTKEIVKFTATPTDAARIITNSTPPPSSVEMPTPQIRYSGEIADVARRLASPEMAGREDVDEMRILLQALIAALRRQPGGRNAIEQLRNELVLDGHHDAAELLRQ